MRCRSRATPARTRSDTPLAQARPKGEPPGAALSSGWRTPQRLAGGHAQVAVWVEEDIVLVVPVARAMPEYPAGLAGCGSEALTVLDLFGAALGQQVEGEGVDQPRYPGGSRVVRQIHLDVGRS